ncbi:MAG TPA: CAP domain-containing protein [Polyangiaceae bacterium]|nr:CAP domain-containing protein [Polyangiaceae bacterium]
MALGKQTSFGLAAAILVAAACSSTDDNGDGANPQGSSGSQSYGGQQNYGGAQNNGGSVVGASGTGTGNSGTVPATCGNGRLDPGEACDGTDFGGASCSSATVGAKPNGSLSCAGCTLDTNGCSGNGGGAGGNVGTGGGPNGSGGAAQGSGGAATGNGGSGNAGNGETGRMVGMTDAINQVRHGVNTQTPLPDMTWSADIAATAQAYADKLKNEQGCNMVHSHAPGLGENLAWFSGQPGTAQAAVGLWASEGDCYNYAPITASDSCPCAIGGACGHYTQLVWRDTTEVGCGVASCGSSEIWVCNFKPPGNYLGQYPY